MANFSDVRSVDTISRIQSSMLELLKIKFLSDISVTDIISKARISRKTFYVYYHSIQDLMNEIEDIIAEGLAEALKKDRENLKNSNSLSKIQENGLVELSDYGFYETVKYCSSIKDISKGILSEHGDMRLLCKIRDVARKEFIERMPYFYGMKHESLDTYTDSRCPVPFEFLQEIYIGSQVNILCLWILSEDTVSPRELRHILGLMQCKSPMELMKISREHNLKSLLY